MVTKLKTTIGTMPCLCCGVSMPVKQSDNGTIDLSCKDCDFSAYAKAGTSAHALALAKVTRKAAPVKQEPAQQHAPEPEPVKQKPATSMAALPVTKRNTLFG